MRHLICLLWIGLINLSSLAQVDTLHVHYFNSGELSTLITLNNHREGKALAFNRNGEVIYSAEVRRFAGSASVQFTHFENGAVKAANYYSAPDGGIQWYRKHTFFSEDGAVIKEQEDSHDAMERLLIPDREVVPFRPAPPIIERTDDKPKKEIAVCGPIHVNRVVFINHTRRAIGINLQHKGNGSLMLIGGSETTEPIEYLSMAITSPPHQNIQFELKSFRRKTKLDYSVSLGAMDTNSTEYIVHIFETSR